ncbi:MAG: NRDE family protein [Bacteroidota bacterium]
MCTLTYIPLAKGDFLLTTNRDESPLRTPARVPEIRQRPLRKVMFPVDGKAGGTWIATADDRRTVCLLNGAFEPHAWGGTYRKSRGLVVLESFDYADTADFAVHYDFEGIEPFTLIGVDLGKEAPMTELRWDGAKLHRKALDPAAPQIWSAAQLYKPEVILRREQWFGEWLNGLPMDKALDAATVQRFHQFGGDGDISNDMRMNRGGMVRTVSTTVIENRSGATVMHYEDLLKSKSVKERLAERMA